MEFQKGEKVRSTVFPNRVGPGRLRDGNPKDL
jgi:hypothetical protein